MELAGYKNTFLQFSWSRGGLSMSSKDIFPDGSVGISGVVDVL